MARVSLRRSVPVFLLAVGLSFLPTMASATPSSPWSASLPNGNTPDLLAQTVCPLATTCVTVGVDTTPSNIPEPVVITSAPTAFSSTVTQIPLPANAVLGNGGALNAVSCLTTWCAAVGTYVTPGGFQQSFVATWTITAPQSAVATELPPVSSTKNLNPVPSAVSCWAVNACVVTGNVSTTTPSSQGAVISQPFVVTDETKGWASATTVVSATGVTKSADEFFGGVSCWAANACMVIGSYLPTGAPVGQPIEFAANFNGTKYSGLTAVEQYPFTRGGRDLVCTNATTCSFLDGANWVATLSNKVWSVAQVIGAVPGASATVAPTATFLSCATMSRCIEGGSFVTVGSVIAAYLSPVVAASPAPVATDVVIGSAGSFITAQLPELGQEVSGACLPSGACLVIDGSGDNYAVALAATTPQAPTGVTATAVSKGCTVAWTAPTVTGGSAITGYQVVVTTGSTVKTLSVGVVKSTTVTGLTPGVTASLTVATVTAAGVSSPTTAVSCLPKS